MSQPDESSFSDAQLESASYRERLTRKLNCLIAVLEVACAKVRRSLAEPEADLDRLTRIHKNLRDTLDVCLRARRALERREKLPADLPANLTGLVQPLALQSGSAGRSKRAAQVELSSREERERFRKLGPIEKGAIQIVDMDELARLLQG